MNTAIERKVRASFAHVHAANRERALKPAGGLASPHYRSA